MWQNHRSEAKGNKVSVYRTHSNEYFIWNVCVSCTSVWDWFWLYLYTSFETVFFLRSFAQHIYFYMKTALRRTKLHSLIFIVMLFHYSSQIVWIFSFSPKNFVVAHVHKASMHIMYRFLKSHVNLSALGSLSFPTAEDFGSFMKRMILSEIQISVSITLFTCMQRCCIDRRCLCAITLYYLLLYSSFTVCLCRHDTCKRTKTFFLTSSPIYCRGFFFFW